MNGYGETLGIWEYPKLGGRELTVRRPNGTTHRVSESADGRRRIYIGAEGQKIESNLDDAGRIVSLAENGKRLIRQTWRRDGKLKKLETPSTEVNYEYSPSGLVSSALFHPGKAGKQLLEWRQVHFNELELPVEIKDYTGVEVKMGYSSSGMPVHLSKRTPKGEVGYHLDYNSEGALRSLTSPWGDVAVTYGADSRIQRVKMSRGNETSVAHFENGKLKSQVTPRGGLTSLVYSTGDALREVSIPGGLRIRYRYEPGGALATAEIEGMRATRLQYDKQGRIVGCHVRSLRP